MRIGITRALNAIVRLSAKIHTLNLPIPLNFNQPIAAQVDPPPQWSIRRSCKSVTQMCTDGCFIPSQYRPLWRARRWFAAFEVIADGANDGATKQRLPQAESIR
jgi:hypothetical protein